MSSTSYSIPCTATKLRSPNASPGVGPHYQNGSDVWTISPSASGYHWVEKRVSGNTHFTLIQEPSSTTNRVETSYPPQQVVYQQHGPQVVYQHGPQLVYHHGLGRVLVRYPL